MSPTPDTSSSNEVLSPRGGLLAGVINRLRPFEPVHRCLLAIGGGYAVSATTATAVTLALTVSEVLPRSEAVVLTTMFAFLVFLVAALWAFAEKRLWRLWVVLGGVSLASVAVTEVLAPIVLAGVTGS